MEKTLFHGDGVCYVYVKLWSYPVKNTIFYVFIYLFSQTANITSILRFHDD
jgi:hypothetical protein